MQELERSTLRGIDRARLEAVVEPIVRAHGAELYDLEWKSAPGGQVLRVYVEKAGAAAARLSTEAAAVDLELCANIARDLSPALDVADIIHQSYNLEVGSPGVERPLRGVEDFARFVGQKAKLKLSEPVEGQRVLRGTLTALEPSYEENAPEGASPTTTSRTVGILDGRREFRVPLASIQSAHLVFEFGPAPKPGKGAGSKHLGPKQLGSKQKAGSTRPGKPEGAPEDGLPEAGFPKAGAPRDDFEAREASAARDSAAREGTASEAASPTQSERQG